MDTGGQLWDAFRAGDMKAFGELYHRYYRPLYNYGFTIFADKEVVMDCLHELFLDLWERRGRLTAVDNIKYYLLVAFRRRIIHTRKRGRQMEEILIPETEAAAQPSAEDRFMEEESRLIFSSRFSEAFNKLPLRRQEAIYLRYCQELSYPQITVVMEVQYQTVRDLISKGIKTLRKELQRDVQAASVTYPSQGIAGWSS